MCREPLSAFCFSEVLPWPLESSGTDSRGLRHPQVRLWHLEVWRCHYCSCGAAIVVAVGLLVAGRLEYSAGLLFLRVQSLGNPPRREKNPIKKSER